MCIGTLVTRRLCSEGTKRFIRDCFVLRGHTEMYWRFTMLRGHWYIIALRECSGISAGIPFGWPQVVVDWERVIWRPSFFPSTMYHSFSIYMTIEATECAVQSYDCQFDLFFDGLWACLAVDQIVMCSNIFQ